MNHKLPWPTLIELAQRETDAAAQALGHAVAKHVEAQTQLEMLTQYRDEYRDSLGTHTQLGVSIASLNNHRAFIDRLESVIRQQRDAVELAKIAIGHCQKEWQQRFCKLKSFDTLAQRQAKAVAHHHAKLEQRQLDEHAAQAFRRHRHE